MTTPEPTKLPSVWARGAQIGAVVCILLLFTLGGSNPAQAVGTLVTSFFIWSIIGAGVVALYRKATKK